jgi:hypothetical protein
MRLGTLIAIIIVLGGGAAGFYFYKRNLGDGSESGSEGDSAPEGASEAQQDSGQGSGAIVGDISLDKIAKKIPGYDSGGNNQGGSSGGNNQGGSDNQGGSSGGSDQDSSGFQPDPNKEFFVDKVGLVAIPNSDKEKIRRTTDWMEGNYRTDINQITNFRRNEVGLTPGGNTLPRRQQAIGLALAFLYQANYIDANTAKKAGKDKIKNFMGWWKNTPRIDKSYPGGALRSYFSTDLMKKFRRHRQARLAAGSGALTG